MGDCGRRAVVAMIHRSFFGIYRRAVAAIGFMLFGPHKLGEATGAAIRAARLNILRRSLKSCGTTTAFQFPVIITSPEMVDIGNDASIAGFVHIWGAGGVKIGDRVMVGTHASVSSITHDYESPEMWQTVILRPVAIEDDVWIGSNAVILPGVTIGRGAVVGASAVVTHDVSPGDVVAGVPARVMRKRSTSRDAVQEERKC
jgi:acetyltransferase-like isoleucine patch superfamily enzyme